MKNRSLLFLFYFLSQFASAQPATTSPSDSSRLKNVIAQYQQARDNRDTNLLKSILTDDIDQLVSTGEWRTGLQSAIDGMMKSSASRPGQRSLTVDKIKTPDNGSALVDCRYEITNDDGSTRKMWSSFLLVKQKREWRISAIRNMLPAAGN